MKPADLRNATWREVLTHLTEDLVRVHLAWQAHGPGTTREIAQKSGISLLTLRPRTTDLYQLGLVDLVGRRDRSGVYAYVDRATAEVTAAWRIRAASPALVEADDDAPVSGSPLSALSSQPQKIGFVTVEEAIASLSPAERRALGARLMGESAHGRHRPEPTATAQLDLLPA